MTEERRIELRAKLEWFTNYRNFTEYEFGPNLPNAEVEFIQRQCEQLGLWWNKRVIRDKVYLAVCKRSKANKIGENGIDTIPEVRLRNDEIRKEIEVFLRRFPVSEIEREQLISGVVYRPVERVTTSSQLLPNNPSIPPPARIENIPLRVLMVKSGLPIQKYRAEFSLKLNLNQILLVLGETGSGKSTQIPQFILDDAVGTQKPCRIIVSEPRRIAAITLADRVASERGERVGDTVGYQIRLESRQSSRTLLTYCTNGVLLKAVTSDPKFFASVTHLILDEVHERDKFSDFLLIVLRDILPSYPTLKLIVMSANLEKDLLGRYLGDHFFLSVPGRNYSVNKIFLEDILSILGYNYQRLKERRVQRAAQADLASICQHRIPPVNRSGIVRPILGVKDDSSPDMLLESIWNSGVSGDAQTWTPLLNRISTIDVNYQHSIYRVTPLMIMAGLGQIRAVNSLIRSNADAALTSLNGWRALEWAMAYGNDECVHRLNSLTPYQSPVEVYHSLVDSEQIDVSLILELLVFICERLPEGAVLVFLPGYEEILQVKEAIADDRRLSAHNVAVCILHSQMHGSDQHRALEPAADGKRKIVLSTNIAELSITLEDVCYVVDTGKMKQTVFDTVNEVSTFSTVWISKTNAAQRAGRAGRCCDGTCFYLYSELRYDSMPEKPIPEILRAPIHELCLQTKLLKHDLWSVSEFLSKAPEPPSDELVCSAVRHLKGIGAFDGQERLTVLGRCLAELPMNPQLGKMILYGTLLRCLDPILTIVAFSSHKDPFVLPRERAQSEAAGQRRFDLGKMMPYSDHSVFLNAFLEWDNARYMRNDKHFVKQHFLSKPALESVTGIKRLVVNALRSLGFGGRCTSHEDFIARFSVNSYWPVVKAALTAGAYPNIALADSLTGKLLMEKETVTLNSASVLLCRQEGRRIVKEPVGTAMNNFPSPWVIFNEICRRNGFLQVQCATVVNSTVMALFAGTLDVSMNNITREMMVNREHECWDLEDDGLKRYEVAILNINDWLKVRMDVGLAQTVVGLREKLNSYFMRKLTDPSGGIREEEEETVSLVVQLLIEMEKGINPGYVKRLLTQCKRKD